MSKAIHGILRMDDKGVHEAESELALMFRAILAELNVSAKRWDKGMTNFLNQRYRPSETKADKRSNQNRSLANPKIVHWDTFVRGLQILGPDRITFGLVLHWRDDIILPATPPDELTLDARGNENELSTFFRMLIRDIGLRSDSYDVLVERWLDRFDSKIRDNPTDRSTVKNNMRKALFERRDFTWSTFSRALGILAVQEFEFSVVMHWPDTFTRHCFVFEPTHTFDTKGSKSDE